MPTLETASETRQRQAGFEPTNWNTVLAAGESDSVRAAEALAALCRTYWYPLYGYVRRKGHSVHDAEDLTQGFFQELLRRQSIKQCRREGKFRSFLLSALENYLAAQWNHAHRQKRGGQYHLISFEEMRPEARYQMEPVDLRSPERIFDRGWALTVLYEALERLRQDCVAAGRESLFQELKGILSGDGSAAPYAEIGARLHMSEVAVKVAAHRVRQRYAELVREAVARTLTNPAPSEVEEEIRDLMAALRS